MYQSTPWSETRWWERVVLVGVFPLALLFLLWLVLKVVVGRSITWWLDWFAGD